jgi:signal transduction histidine kinase
MIKADEAMLYRVLDNVLSNAIKYSQPNGVVNVNARDDHGAKRIEVIDGGVGITKNELPYVWDRFYRGDKSRGNSGNSNGLGLAIVKQILEMHRFNYGIESEEGLGTMVWIEWS